MYFKKNFQNWEKINFYLSYSELLSLSTNNHIVFEDYYKKNIGYYLIKNQIKIIVKSLIFIMMRKKLINKKLLLILKDYEVRIFGLGILIKQLKKI